MKKTKEVITIFVIIIYMLISGFEINNMIYNIVIFVLGFLILNFIIGYNISNMIFRDMELNIYEVIIHSYLLSVTFILLTEMILNLTLAHIKPIDFSRYIIGSLAIFFIILNIIFYNNKVKIKASEISINPIIFSSILILLSLISSYEILYNSIAIYAILTFILSILGICYIIYGKLDKDATQLILLSIALSLSFIGTLTYKNLFFDTTWEYFLSKLVLKSGFWNFNLPLRNNAMTMTVIYHPLLSKICKISLYKTFKYLNPIFCSLVAIPLFELHNTQLKNYKLSAISTFLIISFFEFYSWFAPNTRQGNGFLIIATLLYVIFNNKLNMIKKSTLLILYTTLLVISHYGTAYIYIYLLAFIAICKIFNSVKRNIYIRNNYVLYATIFTIWYYLYSSNSAALYLIIKFIRDSLNIVKYKSKYSISTLYTIHWPISIILTRDIITATIVLILVGLIISIKKGKANKLYNLVSLAFILVFPIFIVNPDFGKGRPYVIGLASLSIFAIICINHITTKISARNKQNIFYVIVILFLILYTLIPAGILSTTVLKNSNDFPPFTIITKNKAIKIKKPSEIFNTYFLRAFYRVFAKDGEISSSQWLSNFWNKIGPVYVEKSGDIGELTLLPYIYLNSLGQSPFKPVIIAKCKKFSRNSYIYLRYFNRYIGISFSTIPTKYIIIKNKFYKYSKVYDDMQSSIYYT